MTRDKRGPGSPSRRGKWAYRPTSEGLEDRKLLATTAIDVTTTQVANSANTPTGPLGVEMIGSASNTTAGYTVTDVGNVTGSGYDSFVVSAPGLASTPTGANPVFGNGQSAAYLVFGSKAVNVNNAVDFLNLSPGLPNTPVGTILTSGQRAGDLAQLGTLGTSNAGQFNPAVQQPTNGSTTLGLNFDGLTFITGGKTNSGLGYSVSALGDLNGDGADDFAIGAPNDAGGGRVFVIYGGTNLANQAATAKTIDLEPTAGTVNAAAPTKVVGFFVGGAATGTNVGTAVGGIGNYFNTTLGRDLGIGVPTLSATLGATNNNTGAAYAIAGAFVNNQATGTSVDLNTIGVNNGVGGIKYTGVTAGDLLGSSISSAGSFDGAATGTGAPIHSLLIGAPGANATGGAVYLVYSVQSTTANSTLGSTQSLSSLGVAPTTNPVTTPLEGVVYNDVIPGDRFGYTVATAGDFNSDGVDDIIIGAPSTALSTTSGVVLVYGVAGTTTTTPTRINGIFTTSTLAPPAGGASFVNGSFGSYAGFSIAPTGHINFTTSTGTQPKTDILIGSPGESTGAAYLVPGTIFGGTAVTGVNQLATIFAAPLNGQKFTAVGGSDSAVQVTRGFGTSVSARNPVIDPTTLLTTLDGDAVPDLFIGAPFSNFVSPNTGVASRTLSGVAYALEGALLGGSSGGSSGGGTGGTTQAAFVNVAASLLTSPIFTGENAGLAFPPVSSLEHLASYAPLPVPIAYQQFLSQPGFRAREEAALHPGRGKSHQAPRGTILNVAAIGHSENKYAKVNTLPTKVFTRDTFKHGKAITFTHKVKVIPRASQTERLQSS